eukprot:3972628-Pleurochrysis_carterae.AAC.1
MVSTYFPINGYYLTGDGARRDKDGYFWITGRVGATPADACMADELRCEARACRAESKEMSLRFLFLNKVLHSCGSLRRNKVEISPSCHPIALFCFVSRAV